MQLNQLTPEELAEIKSSIFREMAIKSNKARAGTVSARAAARYAVQCRWAKYRQEKMEGKQ